MKENDDEGKESINTNPIKKHNKKGKDLKIIIVGDSGTGKTSFVNKYIHNKFAETYCPTIGTAFEYKIVKINDVIYRLQFWDIAGQDRNPETTGVFCKNTNGIILCCEVNKNQTKENTIKWKESIEKVIDIKDIPIIMIENKCDLLGKDEDDYNKDIFDLKNFAENNNINKCFRTSALNGYGVEESILFLVNQIVGTTEQNSEQNEVRKDSIVLKRDSHKSSKRSKKKKLLLIYYF